MLWLLDGLTLIRDSTHFTFVLSALGDDVSVATGDTPSPLATLEELIKHVKNVLPELGDNFIKVWVCAGCKCDCVVVCVCVCVQ